MKPLAILRRALFATICLDCALILGMSAALALPALFGMEACVVMSDSMGSALPRGSLAYIDRAADGTSASPGDIIAFTLEDSLCVHRAARIDEEGGTITTKGDANETDDLHPVPFGDVRGAVRFALPQAGAFLHLLISRKTIVILTSAALAFAYLALAYLPLNDRRKRPKGRPWRFNHLTSPNDLKRA